MWIATIAHGLPVERIRRVVSSWTKLEGLEGVCLVVGPEDRDAYAEVLDPWPRHVRRRWVVPTAPFRRGAWRRLAALCTPTRGAMAFVDADCVAIDKQLLVQTEVLLARGDRVFVVYAPSWSQRGEAEAFLTLGDEKALAAASQRSRGFWSGTVACSRLHAVLAGWDDTLDGWGAEDHAFCQRVLSLGFQQETVHGALVHVWHPSVGLGAHPSPRSLDDKIRNVRELRARRGTLPDAHYQNALDEIHGLPGWLFPALPEPMVHVPDIRWFAFAQAREIGFPLLTALDCGTVPPGATWALLRESTITDDVSVE